MNPNSPFSAAMVEGITPESHRYDTVELMYFARHDTFGTLGTLALVGVIGHELVQCIFELEDLWNGANIIPAQLFCHPVTVHSIRRSAHIRPCFSRLPNGPLA